LDKFATTKTMRAMPEKALPLCARELRVREMVNSTMRRFTAPRMNVFTFASVFLFRLSIHLATFYYDIDRRWNCTAVSARDRQTRENLVRIFGTTSRLH